jgi:pilus assembly protein Flp/PilA
LLSFGHFDANNPLNFYALAKGGLSDPEVYRHWFLEPKQELVMQARLRAFWSNDSGATAIEYGLLAAGIAVAIIAVVIGLGTKLSDTFTTVDGAL